MFYIILNSLGLVLFGTLGMVLKNFVKTKQIEQTDISIGLIILILGLKGALAADNILMIFLSLFIGGFIGSSLAIEDNINRMAKNLVKGESSQFINGIIGLSLIVCMGSMAILGPMDLALKSDASLMKLKIVLDSVTAMAFATVYGRSIYPSAIILLIYQSLIYFLAFFISPYISPIVVEEIGQVGSIILIGLAFNILSLKKIRVMDMTPSLIMPIILHFIKSLF